MTNMAVQISVGSDNTCWCRDSLGKLYKLEGGTWRQNPTAIATQVAVVDANNVWCCNQAGHLFKLKGSAHNSDWEKDAQASLVTSMAVTPGGTIYITNSKGELQKREGGQWSKISSPTTTQPKKTHVVKQGEHLLKILRSYYTLSETDLLKKADQVARLNGWPNREKTLYPNDVIILEA